MKNYLITRYHPVAEISKSFQDKDDGKPVDPVILPSDSVLSFVQVEPSDEGEYGCLAVNEYGSDQVYLFGVDQMFSWDLE